MNKFSIYSIVFHIGIVFLVALIPSFSPAPKKIQITLAQLPTPKKVEKKADTKSVKKEVAEKVKDSEIPKKKGVTKPSKEEVNKLLDSVLKESVEEKKIAVPKKQIKELPESKPKEIKPEKKIISPIIPKSTPKTAEKPKIPVKQASNTSSNQPTATSKEDEKVVLKKTIEEVPTPKKVDDSPYANPILPRDMQQKTKVDDSQPLSPYSSAVLPKNDVKKDIPTAIVQRRKISKESFRDDKFDKALGNFGSEDFSNFIPNDIMDENNFYLSNEDKRNLMNQMSQCMAYLGTIREKTESTTLMIEVNKDKSIKSIKVVKNRAVVPQEDLTNLEIRVLRLFNNPKCAKLALPEGKYDYWKKFTIKLNLKGFFEQ